MTTQAPPAASLSATEQDQLIRELFVDSLAEPLLATPDSLEREQLLKHAIADAIAGRPAMFRDRLTDEASDTDLEHAKALADYRMVLMDGSTIEMGLPYDWYYGATGDHQGAAAPAYIDWRLAFTGTLARAHRTTGNPRYAQAVRDFVADYTTRYWRDGSELPPYDNWLCTAARCGLWYCSRFPGLFAAMSHPALLDCFSFDDLLVVFRTIRNSVNGVIPNLALGSNWRVHELSAIFTQSYAYPFLKDADRWRLLAANGLNESFDFEFADDGSYGELCTEYGLGTWWVFAHYFALGEADPSTGLRFDNDKMHRCLQYYLSTCKPFGMLATLGDGYCVRSHAKLSEDAEPHAGDMPPEWDGNLKAAARCLATVVDFPELDFILNAGPPPSWLSRMNGDSGHLFMRDGWQSDSLYASLNAGHYANCHCHFGLLGMEIAGYGREWIVDAGCSALDNRPTNANLARTRGHNTISVDGQDQQIHVPCMVSRLINAEHYDFAVGIYKGGYTVGNPYGPGCTSAGQYESAFNGTHFRHVLFVKGGYWLLFDAIMTRPGHVAETRLHFMPNRMRTLEGGGYATGYDDANLALLPLAWDGWSHGLHAGEEDPIEGWLPEPGGKLIPAPVYKATRPTDAGVLWHGSLLLPFRGAALPAVEVDPIDVGGAGFAYRIATEQFTDFVFLSNSWSAREVSLGPLATNAPLVHMRYVDGKPVRGLTCEGTYLQQDGRMLFDEPGTMLARAFAFEPELAIKSSQPRYDG